MSIVMNLYYTGKKGDARKFAEEMQTSGIVDKIRNTPGNLRYEYFIPLDDPETVLLIDAWKDQDALDRHHASDTMKEIMALRNKYDLHMQAQRFYPDAAGISKEEAQFICQ